MAGITIERLAPALGAEVSGVDLTEPITDEITDALRQALCDHQLLLVRGQDLSDDEHVAFVSAFGEVAQEQNGPIAILSNQPNGGLGPIAATWHSDFVFFPHPYEALSLYGFDIPSTGTETRFASGVLAASTLPAELRARLESLQGRAVSDVGVGSTDRVRFRSGRCDGLDPHQVRPVLWPHQTTGEKILAVWEQQTDAILPLDPVESDVLLEALFAHLYQPDHMYVHQWRLNDLLVWDNLALQHSRPYVGEEEPRILRRIAVGENQIALWEHYLSLRP
jgi:taurine dioxygenase